MKVIMGVLCFVILCTVIGNVFSKGLSYKAAVVEYAPKQNKLLLPQVVISENVGEYKKLIEEASRNNAFAQYGADIIVFPEDGLTTTEVAAVQKDQLQSYSVEIPDTKLNFNPCFDKDAGELLANLSCAASNNSIYVVINLLEHDKTNNQSIIFYNTNVVFDRNGTIIASYRKINLFYEPNFADGNNVETFKTDFNVTFGIFTCFDILFEKPAIEVLKIEDVTDIVYSAAWFSETPFLTALTVQTGYAIGNGINLLASGYNDPKHGNGGSGIYLANGTVAKTFISGSAMTRLIVQEVPIIKKRFPPNNCRHAVTIQSGENTIEGNLSAFKTLDGIMNYTFRPISDKTITQGSFSCTFNVTLAKNTTNSNTYEYKLALFYGVQKYGKGTAGVRACALVACYKNQCGAIEKGIKTPIIEHVSIASSFIKQGDEFIQPSSSRTDLNPSFGYTFCAEENHFNGMVTVKVATKAPQDSVLSMGFYSRVFTYDGKPVRSFIEEIGKHKNWVIPTTVVVVIVNAFVVAVVVIFIFFS